jgi:HEAT repeat protein
MFWQIFIILPKGLYGNPGRGGGRNFMQNTVAALKNKENRERWKNVVDLEKFGQPAAEFLVQALADEDRWVRYLAADALANIGATNSVDSLISLLRDPEQDVRFAAAAALGKLGDPRAIKSLQEVLKRDNGYVKVAAEEALVMISPQAAGPVHKGSPSH